ncbi:MAG: gamma carbonic anhydrase family protein [Candidatus Cloacimonetes bacterium]|nr:gamma carbonic anhydrase family protein [Candidatus Cloacimonadota bacterium]
MIIQYQTHKPRIAEGAWIADNAVIIGQVEIGEDSSIWFSTVIRGDVNYIRIGARTNIQDLSLIHVTHADLAAGHEGYPAIIGDDVTIGHHTVLHGCRVGKACLIGNGSVLLDGCEIGDESLIGAGSLVTKNMKFPPRSLILGRPAQVVRMLREDEILGNYESAQRYLKYKLNYK